MKKFMIIAILSITLIAHFGMASDGKSKADDKMQENVNPVPIEYSYAEDYDSSSFRMKIYNLNKSEVEAQLNSNLTNLCETAKDSKDIFHESDSSATYIINVLKKSGALDPKDKEYTFNTAHFIWDFYLTFRNFVDISRSYKEAKMTEYFDQIPNGTIIQLTKNCIPNGAVAIYCNKKLYTKRFVKLNALMQRADDPKYPKCKVGEGIRFIVEASRFKGQ